MSNRPSWRLLLKRLLLSCEFAVTYRASQGIYAVDTSWHSHSPEVRALQNPLPWPRPQRGVAFLGRGRWPHG